MEFEKKGKFKVELRTFFSLTILNVVVAALTLALGISLSVTPMLDMIDVGKFDPFSVILIGLGIAAIAGGFYWLMEIVEIMDGIDEIKTAYDELGEDEKEAVTSLIVRMMAYYRSNKPTISRMIALGRIGGILFLIAGAVGMISGGASIASSGVMAENVGQLFGAVISFGVGIAAHLISRYFSTYSRTWDARLKETMKIEEALEQKLEAK
jgi:hypothetical protein